MSKILLVAMMASVLLTTLQAAPLEATSAANFKPRDDPFVLYEDLKDVLKTVNPQLLARVNEEEKQFKHDRDSFQHHEAKDLVDKVSVLYLEVAIKTLKGQLPSQADVYKMAGAIHIELDGLLDSEPDAYAEINGSKFFKGLMWGH